jgi:hypothetical protein
MGRKKGWLEREAAVTLVLNLWPIIMLLVTTIVFLLRISRQ